MPMLYRTFGKTGERVSVLGFGNMRLPVVNGDYGHIDEPKAMNIVSCAIEHGVNYLDTSWPYHSAGMAGEGQSEPFVGKVLKAVGRDKMFVATKLPIWLVEKREDMDAYLDKQLERLGTDYVDFYLVHNVSRVHWPRMVNLDLSSFLDDIQKRGKVRHVGFSFHDTPDLFQEVLDYYDFSFCQHALNYFDINYQGGISSMRKAARRGMGVISMEPVMGGMLGNLFPAEAEKIFDESGIKRSPAAWALRWVWDQPEISFLLSGMSTLEQVEENCHVADMADTPLTSAEMEAYDRVREYFFGKAPIKCTGCNLCSCQYGIAIRDNFMVYNTYHLLKEPFISDKTWQFMLDNTGMEASRCNNCGRCDGSCPLGLNIPWELRKVARYFAHK